MTLYVKKLFSVFFVLFVFNCLAKIPNQGQDAALIIIDMQPYFATRGGHAEDEENKLKINEILNKQIEAITEAKKYNVPIVFIEYDGGYGDTDERLKEAVVDYKNIKYFIKNTDGMFSTWNKTRDEIIEYLDEKKIKELIMTGANGGACVEESISTALDLGKYNVYAYSKGIADFNYACFIYPYDDQYNFQSTLFKEVDCLNDVIDVMNCPVELANSINDSEREVEKNEESYPFLKLSKEIEYSYPGYNPYQGSAFAQ